MEDIVSLTDNLKQKKTAPKKKAVQTNDELHPTNTKEIPSPTEMNVEIPEPSEINAEIPEASALNKEMPADVNMENCVTLQGRVVEIKPTKLKYFRNRTASIYSVLKLVPLHEFLSYGKGTFDKDRDSDQILFDFLVGVFDDAELVKQYYDDMSSEDIERILAIFSRLNHIDEKEEQARKNREAQAEKR